jgi:hypothetical protein
LLVKDKILVLFNVKVGLHVLGVLAGGVSTFVA